MKYFVCVKCGHEVISKEHPGSLRWTDGHVCRFEERREDTKRCRHGILNGQCGFCRLAPSKTLEVKAERPKRVGKSKPGIRTMVQFRKQMRDIAKDTVADGFEIEYVASDLADSLVYNHDIMDFVRRKFPFARTRLQIRELLADYLTDDLEAKDD